MKKEISLKPVARGNLTSLVPVKSGNYVDLRTRSNEQVKKNIGSSFTANEYYYNRTANPVVAPNSATRVRFKEDLAEALRTAHWVRFRGDENGGTETMLLADFPSRDSFDFYMAEENNDVLCRDAADLRQSDSRICMLLRQGSEGGQIIQSPSLPSLKPARSGVLRPLQVVRKNRTEAVPHIPQWSYRFGPPWWYHGFKNDTYIDYRVQPAKSSTVDLAFGDGRILITSEMQGGNVSLSGRLWIAKKTDSGDGYTRLWHCPELRRTGCSADLFDRMRLEVIGGGPVDVLRLRLMLNALPNDSPFYDWPEPMVKRLEKGLPWVLDEDIRTAKLKMLQMSWHDLGSNILTLAVDDFAQAWSPKYRGAWDKVNNGPYEWCSEFAAYYINQATRGLPGGPQCTPEDLDWVAGSNLTVKNIRKYFMNRGLFIAPRDYRTSDNRVIPKTPYSKLGEIIRPGFYIGELGNVHSTLFVRWENEFDPSNHLNPYYCLGGNQDKGRVAITRHGLTDNTQHFSLNWGDSDEIPDDELNGFGITNRSNIE